MITPLVPCEYPACATAQPSEYLADEHLWVWLYEGNQMFMDVGEPTGNCTETSPGVFERNWTYGLASMNCNTYKAGPIPQNPARNNSW